jgi:nucleotide-binding universal stress UspA family protein
MITVKRILYPTDFSSYSNQAYFHAISLAENQGASLTILYVYTRGQGTPDGPAPDETALAYWRNQLEQIRPTNARIPVHHVLLEGDPAAEIVNYAAEAGMDLIVMGTHGRTGLERLLMGSVAEKVMREALCSVLVVKLPKRVQTTEQAQPAVALAPV